MGGSVFVVTLSDVIGLGIAAVGLSVLGGTALWYWVKEKLGRRP